MNERYGTELKYEMILHLATLSILHEQVVNNIDGNLLHVSSSSTNSLSSSNSSDNVVYSSLSNKNKSTKPNIKISE